MTGAVVMLLIMQISRLAESGQPRTYSCRDMYRVAWRDVPPYTLYNATTGLGGVLFHIFNQGMRPIPRAPFFIRRYFI